MLSLVMSLTSFAFPLTSGAAADKPGKVTFEKAEIKEFTLTDEFKSKADIASSVTKAEFAKISDRVPFYVAVTEIGSDNKNTPLDLKSDSAGNVYCDSLLYDPDDLMSGDTYILIAVDENLNLKEVSMENTAYPGSTWTFDGGCYYLNNSFFKSFSGEITFGPIDRGEVGKIKLRFAGPNYIPYDKVYYKTSSDGEYKAWPLEKDKLGLLDVPGKYLGVKFTTKANYIAENEYYFYIDGKFYSSSSKITKKGDEYYFEVEDITALDNDLFTSGKLEDYGYIIDVPARFSFFGENDTGTNIDESKTGKATFENKGDYCEVTIEDLNIEKGELCLFGLEYGVTPIHLIVKGENNVDWLVFDTEVTVICEKGATLSYKHFNILEPEPSLPPPPDYVLGEDTVFDKDSSMFKSTQAAETPTSTATPVPTEAVPEPTTVEPDPTVLPAKPTTVADPTTVPADPTKAAEATATATPAPEATATATPAAAEASATPSATPTVAAEEPKAEDDKVVTYKSYVYKVNQDNSATFTGVNSKDKNISVPSTIKVNGKTVKVTKIAKGAFKNSKAKTVTLGKNVTTIEAGAFNNCSKLTTIVINSNVTVLKAGMFKKCKKLTTIKIKSKKINKIEKKAFDGTTVKKLNVYVLKKMYKKYSPMLIKAKIKKANIKKF